MLCARSNEKNSGEPLAVMGKRLATEIVAFCVDKFEGMLRNKGPGRISFIGHSAGGLIIRKCLEEPCMAPLLSRLHSYISLASPHLGTLYADSQVVSTGNFAAAVFFTYVTYVYCYCRHVGTVETEQNPFVEGWCVMLLNNECFIIYLLCCNRS